MCIHFVKSSAHCYKSAFLVCSVSLSAHFSRVTMSNPAPLLPGNQIVNPITQSGRVVLNARKDTYSIDRRVRKISQASNTADVEIGWGAHDGVLDENFSVLTHEIAVYDCQRDFELRLTGGESVPVITSANGLNMEAWNFDGTEESVSFMGIAGSRALHDSRNAARNEEDCTVQIGGLCTIVNNGGAPITVGEWVAWDFPEPDYYVTSTHSPVHNEPQYEPILGTPFSKRQFRVRGYNAFLQSLLQGNMRNDHAHRSTAQYYADEDNAEVRECDKERISSLAQSQHVLHELTEDAKIKGTFSLQTQGLLQATAMTRKLEGRIFGRAMSTAQPGEPIDIFIGNHLM